MGKRKKQFALLDEPIAYQISVNIQRMKAIGVDAKLLYKYVKSNSTYMGENHYIAERHANNIILTYGEQPLLEVLSDLYGVSDTQAKRGA